MIAWASGWKTAKVRFFKSTGKTIGPEELGGHDQVYEQYRGEIVPKLMEQFSYGSVMEVPRLEKVLNMGLGEAIGDRKIIEAATGDMGLISGRPWLPWRGSLWRALRSVMAIPSAVR